MKKYNILFVFVIALCSLLTTVNAQVDTAWTRRYNGTGNGSDGGYAITADNLGNIYVAGNTHGSSSWSDFLTIKYNSNGDTVWVRKYNGSGNLDDNIKAMAIDNQGNVYVTGASMDSTYENHYATIKYNSAGVEQWVRKYDGPGAYNDIPHAIAVDSQSNVYVTGMCSGINSADCVTIKYNSNGDTAWIRSYNGISNNVDVGYALALDDQGNVYVAGSTYGAGSYDDYLIIKYNSYGDTAWVRRYDNASSDLAAAIAVDNQNNIYVTGSSNSSSNYSDYATVKYNSSGVEQWVRRYDGPLNDEDSPTDIAIDNQNNIYVTGYSYGLSSYEDYATIKYNPGGDTLWVRRYTTPEDADDEPEGMTVDNQGNVYVTGSTDSTGTGNARDILTIKYNSAGLLQWLARFSSPGNHDDIGNAIAVDNQSNVYVTGSYYDSTSYGDVITIKYLQPQGIEENRSPLTANRFSLEVFPNPAKSYFAVRLPLSADRSTIRIYDVTGKIVKSEELKGKNNRVSLDGIKNGIYFIKVGDEMVKEKLVVTKQEVDY
jgi:uncharacterized delta-60 repeat protein